MFRAALFVPPVVLPAWLPGALVLAGLLGAQPADPAGRQSRPSGNHRSSRESVNIVRVALAQSPEQTRGRALFQRLCVRCHGQDGTGADRQMRLLNLPDLTSSTLQKQRTREQFRASISDGKGTGMPAFGDRLSQQDLADLVAFVRTFAGQEAEATQIPRSDLSDFDRRFRQLQKELDELRRQLRELSDRSEFY